MSQQKIVVPVLKSRMVCTVTPPWMLSGSEYQPVPGTFKLLNCGEETFGEIYKAISGARKSICITTWAFQPSMFFTRSNDALCIGELLIDKARKGVKTRILCWSMMQIKSVFLPTDKMIYDVVWRGAFNIKSDASPYMPPAAEILHKTWRSRAQKIMAEEKKNLEFYPCTLVNPKNIFREYEEDVDVGTRITQVVPSFHQKTVLVDYEDPERHVGFVMGHNIADDYFDTVVHPYDKKSARREKELPWQDLSCKVTGEIMEGLYRNFSQAWETMTKGKTQVDTRMPPPPLPFRQYPRRVVEGDEVFGQILRTYGGGGARGEDVENIRKSYLNAIRQASTIIYIENQYFRWLDLASAIKEMAVIESERDPVKHGYLYLFVVTNSANLTFNNIGLTYEMLDSLGRSDTMPVIGIKRTDRRIEALEKELKEVNDDLKEYERYGVTQPGWRNDPKMKAARKREEILWEKRRELEKQLRELKSRREKLEKAKEGEIVHPPETHPGLKVHICTLVPPDMPSGMAWTEVLVHSKLMTVNDTFLIMGSANINLRSMKTDYELDIAINPVDPTETRNVRTRLWRNYTRPANGAKHSGGAQEDVEKAFEAWDKIIEENRKRENGKKRPIASLRGFLSLTEPSWTHWLRAD
jgi:phosphatidylserine/phosphatidylglycerophosphate/cardiolipin synthase-like enzyme